MPGISKGKFHVIILISSDITEDIVDIIGINRSKIPGHGVIHG
jgi:hypothetical protein